MLRVWCQQLLKFLSVCCVVCLMSHTHVCLLCRAMLQELYGDEVGGAMLNALSRLFTSRLQATGFTCGMDDLLLTPAAEAGRSQVRLTANKTALLKAIYTLVELDSPA